ncbi:GTP cyclohydrolase I FolE [soil metagenome]
MAQIDSSRIEAAVRELLSAIGDDPDRAGIAATPARVAASYAEFFSGIGVDAAAAISSIDAGTDDFGSLIVVRDIEFRSMCEHHLLPFLGRAHVAYVPGSRIVGLGDIARAVDIVASRLQLQERLGEQVADALDTAVEPAGVLVVLDAVHQCVTTRGPRQTASSTVTVAGRGELADPIRQGQALALISAPELHGP